MIRFLLGIAAAAEALYWVYKLVTAVKEDLVDGESDKQSDDISQNNEKEGEDKSNEEKQVNQ